MEPIRAFHAVSAGIQLGLAELYRLDMRALDLTAAIDLPAQRRRVDPSQLDRHRPSFDDGPDRRRRPVAARSAAGSSGRGDGERPPQPAEVIFVTSPGLVIPPVEPVPSN